MTSHGNVFKSLSTTVKHSIVFGFGSVINKTVGFLLIPVYTKHLSPQEYGKLAILWICMNIAVSIFKLGLDTAIFRSYFNTENENEKRQVISTTFILILISTLILCIVGYVFSAPLSVRIFGNDDFSLHLLLITIIACLEILKQLPFAVFRINQESLKFSITNTAAFIIQLALIITFVVIKKYGVFGVILGHLIANAVSLLVLYLLIYKNLLFRFNLKIGTRLLRFGIFWMPSSLAMLVLLSADKMVLKHYGAFEQVGLYNLGYQFGFILMYVLVRPFSMIWPTIMLSIKDKSHADLFYARILTYYLLIGSMIVLGINLLAPATITLMADPRFWGATVVIPFLTIGILLSGVNNIFDVGIILKGKSERSTAIFIAGVCINLIANFIFIPHWGMVGAACSLGISYLFICVCKYYVAGALYKVQYEWSRILTVLAVAGVLYFVANRVGTAIQNEYGFILNIFVPFLLPLVLFLFRFYSVDEIEKIKSTFNRLRRK